MTNIMTRTVSVSVESLALSLATKEEIKEFFKDTGYTWMPLSKKWGNGYVHHLLKQDRSYDFFVPSTDFIFIKVNGIVQQPVNKADYEKLYTRSLKLTT